MSISVSSKNVIFILGPSVAYDANWISGIEVIRLAYDAIRTGQCESCIVGTANLALNAEFQWLYSDMGLLSPDGSTKAFDIDGKIKLLTQFHKCSS